MTRTALTINGTRRTITIGKKLTLKNGDQAWVESISRDTFTKQVTLTCEVLDADRCFSDNWSTTDITAADIKCVG